MQTFSIDVLVHSVSPNWQLLKSQNTVSIYCIYKQIKIMFVNFTEDIATLPYPSRLRMSASFHSAGRILHVQNSRKFVFYNISSDSSRTDLKYKTSIIPLCV